MIVKNVEKKEHSTAMFQVEIDADAFEAAINTAYKRNKGSISVAGFRKGKAPRKVIEGMYGANTFYEDAAQILAQEAFTFGVEEAKLDNLGKPSFIDYNVGENKSITLTFSTEIYPEIVLGEYLGLEATYNEEAVTDEDIEKELQETRKRNARMVDVERPVQSGDTITLDFKGFVDGEAFEGGQGENYTLEIGSGTFIPGFEDQLIGMEIGKDGEVKVTFPENYAEHLSAKEAIFKVKVLSIREPQYPELDDEFAKDVSELDTLEEYKNNLRETMERERHEAAERDFRSELLFAAANNMTCEVPESLVNEKIDDFLRNYADSMGINGRMSREELFKTIGIEERKFTEMLRPNATTQARADLLLDKVVEVENIEIGPEEKEAFYKKLEEDYGEETEKIKSMINEELMVSDIARRKAADLIYNSAVRKAPEKNAAADEPSEGNQG